MFFYRLGHIQDLSLAEFASKHSLKNSKYDKHFLLDSANFNIGLAGGFVYGGEILGKINAHDDIAQILADLYEKKPSKKLGISILTEFNPKNLISLAHEIGFKKINLINDREPNAGHFKDIDDWLIIFEFYGEVMVGLVTQSADQDIFSKLDTSLPGGNMKRGKMNLKLALCLLNLSQNSDVKYFWDPFCGQGGIILIDLLFNKKHMIATDIERSAIKDLRLNLDWFQENFPKENEVTKVLHIEKLNAATLAKSSLDSNIKGVARKTDQKFDFNKTAIITEGYLGPTYNRSVPVLSDLNKTLDEIESIWQACLAEAQILGIPEIVFCLPAYKYKPNDILRIDLENVVKNTNYKVEAILPGKYFIDYSRPNSFVIHQIQRVSLDID
jgi:hypothetical protein